MPTLTIGNNTGDSGSCDETMIHSDNPTTNYGSSVATALGITNYSGGGGIINSSLVKFDLSGIPSGATIDDVGIFLYQSASNATGDDLNCYRLLEDWVESEATYNIYSTGNSWDTAGAKSSAADRSSTLSATIESDTTSEVYKEWNTAQLITDVQNFIDSTWSNYGWLFEAAAPPSGYHDYHSTEADTDGTWPYIVVEYTEGSASSALPLINAYYG